MKTRKYTLDDLKVTTFLDLNDDERAKFSTWALSLKPDLDGGEFGLKDDGTVDPRAAFLWVLRQHCTGDIKKGGLYQTFVYFDKATGEFVATGSIVRDDREPAVASKIGCSGFLGFINVRRDLRGRGLGKVVCDHLNKHIQYHVDASGQDQKFSLFTADPVAVGIYKALGFAFVRTISIPEFGIEEDLYTKPFVANTARIFAS